MKFPIRARRPKYGNRKVEVNGQKFDSLAEARRYGELLMLERVGKVRDINRQVKFELIPKVGEERACSYVADFVYLEKNPDNDWQWHRVVEDVKGMRTPDYIIKRKLMRWRYGIAIQEIGGRKPKVKLARRGK